MVHDNIGKTDDTTARRVESEDLLVGTSAPMRALRDWIRRVAPSGSTVLIEGESGSGKELVATMLHRLSGRPGLFVPVNCGSMSAELLDSELFGHAMGAFTGASQHREGLLRHAEGGTLFLDEIGELPLFLQSKLLRVMETLTVRPVGADREVPVDVRFVAATNRVLSQQVDLGAFRRDLYYRLNVLSMKVAPLRERAEDIEALFTRFAQGFATSLGLPPPRLGRAALRRLQGHAWPGNVRELRNLVERAMLLGQAPEACLRFIARDPCALQDEGGSGYPLELPLAEVRRRHMDRMLRACRGNKSEAARRMGISRKTLERQLARPGRGGDEHDP